MFVPLYTIPAPPPWGRVACGARCFSPPSHGDPRRGFTVSWCLRSLLFGSPGAGGKGRTGRLREGQRRSRPVARLSGRLRQSGRCPRARRGCPAVPSLLPGRISGPLLLLAPLRHGGAALGCGDRRWHLRHQPEGTGCSKHSAWGGGEAGKGHILVCTRSPTYLGSPAVVLGMVWWLPVPVAAGAALPVLALLGGVPRLRAGISLGEGESESCVTPCSTSSRPRPGWQLGGIRFSNKSWECRFCCEV